MYFNNFLSFEFFTQLNSNTILAVCAILVSIIGLWINAGYNRSSLNITIMHNKKTTEPHLVCKINAIKHTKYKLYIKNNGFGPAIISSINFLYNNEIFDNFQKLIDHFILQGNNINLIDSMILFLNTSTNIGTNSNLDLINLNFNANQNLTLFFTFLINVQVEIKYENIYGDEKVMTETLMMAQGA